MEGRKLQLTGGSTYVVSLPKPWVTAAGLHAGDLVFVETEPDGSISIRPQPKERPPIRRKIFEEKGEERRDHLLRKLIGAYISGYGLIEVRFPQERGPFVRRVAREFCRMVIGAEIIEETRNAVVMQDLSDASELSAEKGLRRMYMTVRAMLEDALLALETKDEALASDVVQRDQDVDRLYWLVVKQYHVAHGQTLPAGGGPKVGIHDQRIVAKLLERIGDHAERIARTYPILGEKTLDPNLMKELKAARESAVRILDAAFHALFAEDLDMANAAVDERGAHEKLIGMLSHHAAARKGEELLALAAVIDSLGRAASYAVDIAEVAINHAVSRHVEAA